MRAYGCMYVPDFAKFWAPVNAFFRRKVTPQNSIFDLCRFIRQVSAMSTTIGELNPKEP